MQPADLHRSLQALSPSCDVWWRSRKRGRRSGCYGEAFPLRAGWSRRSRGQQLIQFHSRGRPAQELLLTVNSTVADNVVEEGVIETFVPHFLLLKTCQKVHQQQRQVAFGIVPTHNQGIILILSLSALNLPVLPPLWICRSLPPYSHYGFSKTGPSVRSKSWTRSPPLWIRRSGGASNLGSGLTLPF